MVRTCRVVPKDWTKYDPIGTVIPKTRFIVFKTPLHSGLNNRIPHEKSFTVTNLFRTLAERDQRLGMVVDLTDTFRYYDRKEIEGMCIHYEKLLCAGRGFVEREDIVQSFNAAIEKFMGSSDDGEGLIGVHCTRGVNRSGYLVCRFLIDCLGWSSHEAIDAFEKARGYAIEKGAYIAALHRAAKEKRFKQQKEADSDSGESAQEKRKKRKRKRKEEDGMGGNVAQMGDMIKQFLGVLGQEARELDSVESPFAVSTPDEAVQSSSQGAVDKEGESEDGEELDDDELETLMAEGGVVLGYVPDQPDSNSSKRRARRKKLQHMFHVMKRGRFHEIQDVLGGGGKSQP